MTRVRVTRLVLPVVSVVVASCFVYPFAIQVATSFKTASDAAAHPLSLVPSPPALDAWRAVLGGGTVPVGRWLANSVLVTVVVTASRVLLDSLAGYALSRLTFRGRRTLLTAVLAVMAVPGVALLIPKFLMVTYLGIYDTYAAMIVPLMVDAAGVYVMKHMFDTIPVCVEEAALLDGATPWQTYWHVVLPMARPALVTLTILSVQASWNELSHFLVTTGSPDHKTLVTGLADLTAGSLGAGSQHPLKMATALVTTIPVAAVFIVAQRYLVGGGRDGADGR